MKPKWLLMFAVLLCSAVACAGTGGETAWPTGILECAKPAPGDLLTSLSRVLFANGADSQTPSSEAQELRGMASLTEAARDELADLGDKYGRQLVMCGVDEVMTMIQTRPGSAGPDRALMLERGEDFLGGVQIQRPAQVEGPSSRYLWPLGKPMVFTACAGFVPRSRIISNRELWHVLLATRGDRI